MAKVKLSKTELKRQRDLLRRFTRFLPTLQLKKQQLQMEILKATEERQEHADAIKAFDESLTPWIELLSSAEFDVVPGWIEVDRVITSEKNIAGVDIPVFEHVSFKRVEYDLFTTPAWIDEGLSTIQKQIALQVQLRILDRQLELLRDELRTTTQRVNLFEKVKIPEAKESIRKIRIYLGDQQTAAVGRAKIAKNKLVGAGEEAHS
jgi:V/A-type H+/Na+-transporting ATPase subunit D